MVSIFIDDGMQKKKGQRFKTHQFMDSLVRGHAQGCIESKYGLRFAWLGSIKMFFGFTVFIFDFI